MTRLDTLKRHEAALEAWARTAAFQSGEWATYAARVEAYEYFVAHVRAEIAKAEAEAERIAARCETCSGTGRVFSWSSLTDETECGDCRGSGRTTP